MEGNQMAPGAVGHGAIVFSSTLAATRADDIVLIFP